MKKIFILSAFYIFSFISLLSAEVFIDCEEKVFQGKVSPVYILSDEVIDNISLTINKNNKSFGKYRGFLLRDEAIKIPEDTYCYVILISIPSDASPDNYSLDIRWLAEGYACRQLEKLTIAKLDFRSENIPLTKGLTSLRKDESDRRKKETKAIIRLYQKFNTKDQFVFGNFEYPLKGIFPVTSHFGDRRNFLYDDGDKSKSLHNGIDYAAVKGTPVYSAANGIVVFSGNRLITGNSVIIEHNPGFYSVYYHLDKTTADKDSIVKKGDKIGEVGSSGISTGNHLHWEVRNQGIAVDPEQFIASPLIDKVQIISIINSSFSDIDRGR